MPCPAEQADYSCLPEPARFVPYADVGDRPNIVVDGAPLKSTVLTLSHWPVNTTPVELKRDTSTETVFAYLDAQHLHQRIRLVSNNHFDEDGLCSMFALCEPETALANRELLVNTALAGDFGTSTDPAALRLFFLIEAFADAEVSPLPPAVFAHCERRRTVELYANMLERLPGILADLDAWSCYWQGGEKFLEQSEGLLRRGEITIEEHPSVDLAVVRIPADLPLRSFRRYLAPERAAVHPFSIHRRTDCSRLLWIQGTSYVVNFRYESWVQLVSRRPALRVEMKNLAERLDALETADGRWVCDPVTAVCPKLYLDGSPASTITADRIIAELMGHLRDAPVAWDPYDWSAPD